MLQHARLYQLPKPNKHDLGVLREWYNAEDGGGTFMPRPEGDAWNEDVQDLVALSNRPTDGDVFTRWMGEIITPCFHRLIGYRIKVRLAKSLVLLYKLLYDFPQEQDELTKFYDYEDSKFNSAANLISIILSSLFPPASIFVLYYVKSTVIRLVLILVFSAVFTACLSIFTSAKRVEIFAATATLASVQVVFIGTNNPVL